MVLTQEHMGLEFYSYSFHSISAKLDLQYADNGRTWVVKFLSDLPNIKKIMTLYNWEILRCTIYQEQLIIE